MKRTRTPWEPRCHWCHHPINSRTPFSTPNIEIPGSSWQVCGPGCESRPPGLMVFSYRANWWKGAA